MKVAATRTCVAKVEPIRIPRNPNRNIFRRACLFRNPIINLTNDGFSASKTLLQCNSTNRTTYNRHFVVDLAKKQQAHLDESVSRISKMELEELIKKHISLYPAKVDSEQEPVSHTSIEDLQDALDNALNSGGPVTLSTVLDPLQKQVQKQFRDDVACVPTSVPYYLIDVRDQHEILLTGAIDTAIVYPFGVFQTFFEMKPDEFEHAYLLPFPAEDSLFILYCHNGMRAADVCKMLSSKGYHNVRLYHGGAAEWFNMPLQVPKAIDRFEKIMPTKFVPSPLE